MTLKVLKVEGICEFLGMVQFCQTWVPDFRIIVKSLRNPENARSIAHIWILECQWTFENTKEPPPAMGLSNP